ncbi:MAG TPA: hypothetical protein VKO83_01000 [Steroidobacteraceae bacterium]|nr:hypothetical protein [Steroidobacteraceae bacterium]
MDGEGTGAARWRVGEWLADGSMEAVAEINAQCLDFLCQIAAQPARRMPGMFGGQLQAWRELSPAARAQLAASPYLLVEAGFDDEARWALPARRMVQDLPTLWREPVFTGPAAEVFMRSVLVLGWHLARANRQLARVVLGMSPACAARVAALRLRDLDWVVEHHPGWVRPRWERHPRVWRHLLGAALDSDTALLTQVSLRGLQLMAAGVLSPGVRGGQGAAL